MASLGFPGHRWLSLVLQGRRCVAVGCLVRLVTTYVLVVIARGAKHASCAEGLVYETLCSHYLIFLVGGQTSDL